MNALVLNPDNAIELATRPRPACAAPDDVVVRVVQTGICGTDRSIVVGKFHARPGVILGHEAVGEVSEVGHAVSTLEVGDRVIINPTLWCGMCRECRRGRLDWCGNKTGNEIGIDRDGAFAEYILLAERFLYRIPDDMSYDQAVGVEPLACVLNNLDPAVAPGDSVTVLGAGPIGLTCALAVSSHGGRVRLVEADPQRRELAAAVLDGLPGHRVSVHPAEAPDEQVTADVVIDTVGDLLERAMDLAELGGTVVIMGFNANAEAKVRPLEVLQRGIRILGAGEYNSLIFPRAIELARQLPMERLITHRFTLDQHQAAFRTIAATGGASDYSAVKVVIEGRVEGAR